MARITSWLRSLRLRLALWLLPPGVYAIRADGPRSDDLAFYTRIVSPDWPETSPMPDHYTLKEPRSG